MSNGIIEKLNHDPTKTYLGIKMEGEEWANCFDEGTIAMYDAGNLKEGQTVEYDLTKSGKWTNIKLVSSVTTADQLPREQTTINPEPIQAAIPKLTMTEALEEAGKAMQEFLTKSTGPAPNSEMQLDCVTRMANTMFIQGSK
jgi:hypothetical protein